MGLLSSVKWLNLLGIGVVTVGVGTYVAVSQNQSSVETELSQQVQAELASYGMPWAEVRADGRTITVLGVTTNPDDEAKINGLVVKIEGVADIETNIDVAAPMQPFALKLSKNGDSRSISGGMPSEKVREATLSLFGEGEADLTLASGGPNANDWRDAAEFSIRLLQHFDQGEVSVEGLTVSMSGIAKDQEAYETLDLVFGAGFPDNLTRGEADVTAPLISPYVFGATKNKDGSVVLQGYVPNRAAKDALAKESIASSLQFGSGEPDGFEDVREKVLEAVQSLESGEVMLQDNAIAISGAPKDFAQYDSATAAMEGIGNGFAIENNILPPIAAPFELELMIADGEISFNGVVATSDQLESLQSQYNAAESGSVRIARGVPEQFESNFALLQNIAPLLDSGSSVKIVDQNMKVSGVAIDPEAHEKLIQSITNVDEERIDISDLRLPTVTPYQWSLQKNQQGHVLLAGYAPSKELIAEALQLIRSENESENVLLATGQPAKFENIVLASADASNHMVTGSVQLVDSDISIDATIANSDMENSVLNAFSQQEIQPELITAQFTRLPPPLIENYTFSASKTETGFSFDGYVPTEELQLLFSAIGQSDLKLGGGEPEGFAELANAGLSALQNMDEGQLSFAQGKWVLSGQVETLENKQQIIGSLGELTTNEDWHIDIEARIVPIVPYRWSAEKSLGGAYSFGGYVPDQEVLKILQTYEIAENGVETGVGAPNEFTAKMQAGLAALAHLDAGRVSVTGDQWTIIGRASSNGKLAQLTEELAPFSSVYRIDVHLVEPIDQLAFSISWDGTSFDPEGYVADAANWNAGESGMIFIGAELEERKIFNQQIRAASGLLTRLSRGELQFDGETWSLIGDAENQEVIDQIQSEVSTFELGNWDVSLTDLEAQAEAEEKARLKAEAKAKAEAEEKARLEAEARAKAEAEEKARLEAEAEEKARLEAEAKAKAEAEEKARLEAEAKAQAEAEEKARLEAEAKAKAEAEEKARLEAEAKAKAEAEEKARLEAEAKAKAEAEEKARLEAEVEEKARLEAEAKAKAEAASDFNWQVVKSGEGLALTGHVPDAAARYSLELVSSADAIANLEVGQNAPDRFLPAAFAAIEALELANDGEAGVDNGRWHFKASASNFEQRDAIQRALAKSNIEWEAEIVTPPASVICSEIIAELVKARPIEFQSGSTRLNASSEDTVAEIAAQLQQCPNTVVEVEGHTDSDGAEDANLTLSVMRAEQVVDLLIEKNVSQSRLFAIGYGESLPIASNDTREGKRQNRRIVFTVRENVE
jgi:outer membrane protein OmpA-like peptidoglycan-associated protein